MKCILFFKCRGCGSKRMKIQINLTARTQFEECRECGSLVVFDAKQ